jgi:hypothetical protein
MEDKMDVTRAFKLAKQDEASKKANQGWMSGIQLLKGGGHPHDPRGSNIQ